MSNFGALSSAMDRYLQCKIPIDYAFLAEKTIHRLKKSLDWRELQEMMCFYFLGEMDPDVLQLTPEATTPSASWVPDGPFPQLKTEVTG